MFRRITILALCGMIILSSLAGCNKTTEDDVTPGTSSVTTVAPGGSTENKEDIAKKEAQIKQIYTPTPEDAKILAEEKTASPITYSGFDFKYFSTPAKVEGLPIASATPIYSHSGLHNYVEQNSTSFDLGDGDGSFALTAEKYLDSFFADKAILILSFADKEGGGSYTVTGAWEEHIHAEDLHLDQLIFAVKKTPGENKNGHLIIEVDPEFLGLWGSISMEIYE